MDRIDLSRAPGPIVNAAKGRILRAWRDDRTLDEAIADAAASARATAREAGYDEERADRMGRFVEAVGAELRAAVLDVTRPA